VTGAADGTAGAPSIDALSVATEDGGPLAPGRRVIVRVDATFAVPGSAITLWYTGRALQGGDGEPTRTPLATIEAVAAGASTFTARYELPEGALHGLFARATVPGQADAHDEDHLVFFTEGEDSCPSTWLACGSTCTFAGPEESCRTVREGSNPNEGGR
jgi:hypothetical protein